MQDRDLQRGEFFVAIPIAFVILVLRLRHACVPGPVRVRDLRHSRNPRRGLDRRQHDGAVDVRHRLVSLIGLGIAIDYSLLMVYRYREERRAGKDREEAVVVTMLTAGRAVIFSGTAVAIGLALLLFMPLPFIRGFGIAGLTIPIVSVVCALTLLPALLYTTADRLDRVRLISRKWLARREDDGTRVLDAPRADDHAPAGALRHGLGRGTPRRRDSRVLAGRRPGHQQGDPAESGIDCGAQRPRRRGRGGGHRTDRGRDRHRPSRRSRRSGGHRGGGAPRPAVERGSGGEDDRAARRRSGRRSDGTLCTLPGHRRARVRDAPAQWTSSTASATASSPRPGSRAGSRSTRAAGRRRAWTSSASPTARSRGSSSECSRLRTCS